MDHEHVSIALGCASVVLGCSGRAVKVYLALSVINKIHGQDATIEEIANMASVSRKTVFDALKELEHARLVYRQPRFHDDGGRASSNYILAGVQ